MQHARWFTILLLSVATFCLAQPALADSVDFPGTIAKVDAAAGKVTVNKEGGGSRFTFVASDKTHYAGVSSLKELKAGDHVTVTYASKGGQYFAEKIVKK